MVSSSIKLPFDLDNPENDKDEIDNLENDVPWSKIKSSLNKLKEQCELFQSDGLLAAEKLHGDARFWLRNAISKYNKNVRYNCNFKVVERNDQIVWSLIKLLPLIVDNALALPERIRASNPLCILKQNENGTVILERNVVCSLLANFFFSTFPKQDSTKHDLPSINFWRLFHWERKGRGKISVKREKLKCILAYFESCGKGDALPNTKIKYERRFNASAVEWGNSTEGLDEITLINDGKIEDSKGMMHVDFANKYVGGGVLTGGALQEEIMFCISPELMAARLFTEKLEDTEVLVISGARQFSSYTGYRSTFKCKSTDISKMGVVPVDADGCEMTQVVAMDALDFDSDEKYKQYKRDKIERELHKSYVAFGSGNLSTSIATGRWGCGAFNGDPQLKFLLQYMAASQNKRSLVYYVQDSSDYKNYIKIRQLLGTKKVTVGKLHKKLLNFEKKGMIPLRKYKRNGARKRVVNVFQYLQKCRWG